MNNPVESAIDEGEQKSIALVDPATAAAAVAVAADVVSIASGLWSMFGKNDNKEVLKQLKIIRKQNEKIIEKLAEILAILNNLGVIVRQAVREEITVLIKTRLSVALTRFYETYQVDVEQPALRKEAAVKFRELKPVFADLGRLIAMGETYGYAHFNSVGISMIIETWLSRRLGESSAFRQQALLTYKDYFEKCLDPAEPYSIGMQLATARAQAARLDAVLDTADALVSEGLVTLTHHTKQISVRTTKYYDVELRAAGNRIDGYTYLSRELNVRQQTEGVDNGGGGAGGGGHFLPADPVDTGDQSVPGRVAYWETVRKVRASVTNDLKVLDAYRDSCALFRRLADEAKN